MRFISILVFLVFVSSSALAQGLTEKGSDDSNQQSHHSFQWFVLPLVTFNSLQLGYEYKLSPRIGLRADGALILSMGGSAAVGALSSSFIVAQATTATARHEFEVDIGIATGVYGGGHCNNAENQCDDSGLKPFNALKGFIGYRLQKHSGFQFRLGVAPFVTAQGDMIALPELTFGTAF